MSVVPCCTIITGKAALHCAVAIGPGSGDQRRTEGRLYSVTIKAILNLLTSANDGNSSRSRDPGVE